MLTAIAKSCGARASRSEGRSGSTVLSFENRPPRVEPQLDRATRRSRRAHPAGGLQKPVIREPEGFTVLDAGGKAVDPSKFDWAAYSAKTLPFRLRLGPGPTNPMGAVKFSFPNEFQIFLHDTPDRDAFKDMQRAFSFGCVRVEKPLELAELLLNDPSRWRLERLLEITRTQNPQTIRLPHPMPIMLVYMTVLVEQDGTLFFRDDVYERDKAVLKALNERNEMVSHPGANEPDGWAHAITSRK